MPDSIKTLLSQSGVLQHVVLSPGIDLMLDGLVAETGPDDLGGGISTGTCRLTSDLSKSPIPGFDFSLALPTGVVKPAPFKLKIEPSAFKFWLLLADQEQALFIFKFLKGLPGLALTGATKVNDPDGGVSLKPLDPPVEPHLVSRAVEPGSALGPALLVSGSETEPSGIRFTPDTDSTEGVITLGIEPEFVLFGSSSVGFDCPAVIIDDSETDKGPGSGAPALDPPLPAITADTPSWRGILARELDFYLPADVPLFGGQPIKGYLAIPRGPGGAQLVVETNVPARPASATQSARPGYGVRIECLDPTATGLSGLVPTLIALSMELPLDGASAPFQDDGGGGRTVQFAAGKPVRATATFSRDPVNAPDTLKIAVGVAGQGPEGLLSVTSNGMGGAKIFNTVAALATALIADKDIARKADVGDTKGVVLYGLLAAGAALSSLFTDDSHFVLHGVQIESSGHGAPVGGPIVVTLDYSVAVRVTEVDVGVLSVSMKPDQPMRIRVREARMSLDPGKSGLDMIGLDFDRASMEIENPGAWNVSGLESLFDVLGSRSGRGSSWLEVDLGFKLNLGPIKVSGATIRATLEDNGSVSASIRGLEAGLTIPGAIDGTGAIHLLDGGFAADLRAKIIPLNVAADAGIIYAPPMIVLRLDVDLPAPIPLANTGFGLLGIGGLLGFSAVPDYASTGESDPVLQQLKWAPQNEHSFATARGESSFGLAAAVGTLPDLGFTFSAKAGVLITVPDVAVRGSLNGKVLQPAVSMSDPSYPPSPGISFLGFIGVDAQALSFALLGEVNLKPLLEIKVPIAGHFPFTGDMSDWYVYLGADGAPEQGRSIGPISATVLPDILGISADAYFMARGKGIADWPYGRALPSGPLTLTDGFVVAFGFGLQSTFGVKPVVWAELYAGLDLLVAAKPPTLAGFGSAGGSLNLGPFSLGVQAQVAFMLSEAASYLWAQVTGKIELFFFDIEGTVTISFGKEPSLALPAPDLHPLDALSTDNKVAGTLGSLTDDTYRVIAPLVEDPGQITDAMRVWPDAMISLPFAITPEINTGTAGAQFPAVVGPGATPPPARIGSELLHYNWRLESVALVDVTHEADKFGGAGTPPSGQLASRWQVPRSGSGGSDLAELLLFSSSPDLWINRTGDAGSGLPGDPLHDAANICGVQPGEPVPGWAVGFLAGADNPGFRLPPDPVSLDPRVSRVEAHVHHFGLLPEAGPGGGAGRVLLDGAYWLPEPFTLEDARLVAWPSARSIVREFDGHFVAPNLHWLDGRDVRGAAQSGSFAGQEIRLVLTEPVVSGQLILVAQRQLFNLREQFFGLRVLDDTGAEWTNLVLSVIPTGEVAALYDAPTDRAVSQLTISFPLGAPLGIVGVGGITDAAREAVAAETAGLAAETARQAAAAAAGPKTDPSTNVAHQRAILDPGRLYRLDVDMSWKGQISKQNGTGQVVTVGSLDYDDPDGKSKSYDPRGGAPGASTRRQLFFATTPKAQAQPKKPGEVVYSTWLHRQQDVFHPDMLQRYLAGYDPGQSEQFRFCDDPLRAHFLQDHIAALAKAYGFDLKVAVRRVDRPGPQYAAPQLLTPAWSFITDPSFLSETDRVRYVYAEESECSQPLPGSTATVTEPLEPQAWYDIFVLAQSLDAAFADGTLPGVTFKTSRWRTPAEMMAGLGLTVAGGPAPAAVVTGDLAVQTPGSLAPAVAEDDDGAFEAALTSLGLDDWPPADSPRLSRLWTSDGAGSWLFAGLMVESPEPIHRPGRVELTGLSLDMGIAQGGISFDIRRRDRLGARLLYLTSTPFQVVTSEVVPIFLGFKPFPRRVSISPQLILHTTRKDTSGTGPLDGSLIIPAMPDFAGDPS